MAPINDENNKELIDEFHDAVKRFKSKGFTVESNLALHNNGKIHIGITVTNDSTRFPQSMPTTKLVVAPAKSKVTDTYHYPPGCKR